MMSFVPSETPECSPDNLIISRTIHQDLVPQTTPSVWAVKKVGESPDFLTLLTSRNVCVRCVLIDRQTHTR